MSRKQKRSLYLIIISAALLIGAAAATHFAALPWWGELLIFLVPYIVIGGGTLKRAAVNILHGQVFDENFLMAIATVGALCIGEYSGSCFCHAVLSGGLSYLKAFAVGKSPGSLLPG